MSENRLHRAVSADGTELVGRVHGQGPPLVLVSGTGDGENSPFLLPNLGEYFTCYSMSLRGRGLSGASPDHAPERLVEDVAEFVDSIGQPVGLAGHSRGAAQALGAAAQATGVSAAAIYEPTVVELLSDDDVARVKNALERMQAAADEGRLTEAAQIFFKDITLPNPDELTILSESGAFDFMAPIIPTIIQDISQWRLSRPTHTLQLERVTMPVLLMHGTRTHRFYTDVVRYLAERLPDPEVHAFTDAGHFSPLFAPAPIAERVVKFFEAAA